MMHRPIQLNQVSLYFPPKICFENFTAQIQPGQRIGLMGRNGSGKSTLLELLQGKLELSEGEIHVPGDVIFGHVPQIIPGYDTLSGGQRFNEALTQTLALLSPNVLLLDEPSNHLDLNHRRSLLRMLDNFKGTLIMVTHDVALLRHHVDTLWHIDQGNITVFSGKYDDYFYYLGKQQETLQTQLAQLKQDKKQTHHDLMREQERAKKRKIYGEKKYAGDTIALRSAQGRGELTHNKNKKKIEQDKNKILQQLERIYIPENIKPKFSLTSAEMGSKNLISIHQGACGYQQMIVNNIYLQLQAQERMAIIGNNGSGKSTLLKAILNDPNICRSGDWIMPKTNDIGYLDQHYATLVPHISVFDTIKQIAPHWNMIEIRRHLADFLFKKNEEVDAHVKTLSGGERTRLALACIAAKTPKLLILDEISNNLDLETRNHVIQVLRDYPGAILMVSHDEDFLKKININNWYSI